MTLSDVAGILSRYFVVGFFIPTFFGLVAIWQSASPAFIPDAFDRHYEGATAVAILAAGALPTGLVLLGLEIPIIRFLEGYYLQRNWLLASVFYYITWPVYQLLRYLQLRTFRKLSAQAEQEGDANLSDLAAWKLNVYFPPNAESLMPTRFGNAVRAFEYHGETRWGLDGVANWPRIAPLLSEPERESHGDAQTAVAFFVNSCIAAAGVGCALMGDWIAFRESSPSQLWWLCAFLVGYLFYRGAVEAATRWGNEVRASIDLHRLEMYEKVGLRVPSTVEDEKRVAGALNLAASYYGYPIPDEVRAGSKGASRGDPPRAWATERPDLKDWLLAIGVLGASVCFRRKAR
jgi:hypothetical protein